MRAIETISGPREAALLGIASQRAVLGAASDNQRLLPSLHFFAAKRRRQALHRIRDQLVGNRTRLICQMRAFCLEYGVATRQGAGVFKLDLPMVIADASNDLTPTMRRLLAELFEDLGPVVRARRSR